MSYVALVDVNLPGKIDGIEVSKQICSDIPVIFCSSYDLPEQRLRADKIDHNGYFVGFFLILMVFIQQYRIYLIAEWL